MFTNTTRGPKVKIELKLGGLIYTNNNNNILFTNKSNESLNGKINNCKGRSYGLDTRKEGTFPIFKEIPLKQPLLVRVINDRLLWK